MENILNLLRKTIMIVILFSLSTSGADKTETAKTINVQNLQMNLEPGSQVFCEELLPGEIAGTNINHVILANSISRKELLSKKYDTIFLFIKGKGSLIANNKTYNLESEFIVFPVVLDSVKILAAEDDTLHYVIIQKELTQQDLVNIKSFPFENRKDIYITSFKNCQAYTEKIKSPNTVSRTVLPKDYVPRTAMGTVETIGPDEVAAHIHPMLDQLFLGLASNNIIVHADDKSVQLNEFSLLHIPIGSNHWSTVEKGKLMYYLWMDFFITKEGEIWLNTHKPIEKNTK